MTGIDVRTAVLEVEHLLNSEELTDRVELAIEKLLNVIEVLTSDKQTLADEVARLRKKLDERKKRRTTAKPDGKQDPIDEDQPSNSDHSSEKQRRKRRKKQLQKRQDRRSFKDLTIHDTIKCPIDPVRSKYSADAKTPVNSEFP